MKRWLSMMLSAVMLVTVGVTATPQAVVASETYSVYQTTRVYEQRGIGGFSILADFPLDVAPGEIYFERVTQDRRAYNRETGDAGEDYSPFDASCIALVIDPDGLIAGTYDFSNVGAGTHSAKITLNEYKAGIWEFKFISSRVADVLSIGIKNNVSNWGIRGECILSNSSTLPGDMYVYVPEKVNRLYVGGSTESDPFEIYDESSQLAGSGASVNLTEITDETVYKISLPETTDTKLVVDYAPSLLCPTKDMALALKGGWYDVDGVLVQGNIQKRARETMLEFYESENFEYTTKKPVIDDFSALKYPLADRRLLNGDGTAISDLKSFVNSQNLDTKSPYFGTFLSANTPTWEDGTFGGFVHNGAFGGLVNIDSQISGYYRDEALINRTALSVLGHITSLSEDFMIKNGNAGSDPVNFTSPYYASVADAYMFVNKYFELGTDVRSALDDSMSVLTYKMGTYRGQGPTNQWLFTVKGVTSCYLANDNNPILKGMMDRHIDALTSGLYGNIGFNKAGFFAEGNASVAGLDGNYNNLSRAEFYGIYERMLHGIPDYPHLPKLTEMVEKSLQFDALFYIDEDNTYQTEVNGNIVTKDAVMPKSNASSSRTYGEVAPIGDGHRGILLLLDEFPLAKRKYTEITDYYYNPSEVQADLETAYEKYDENGTSKATLTPYEYEAFTKVEAAPTTILPIEDEGTKLWNLPGLVAVKHKDMYMNIFYETEGLAKPSMSYLGGGMTLLWAEGVEGVSSSRKPGTLANNTWSKPTGYDTIVSACVFGKKTDDTVFLTGKETSEFTMLEPDKKFKISGTDPNTGVGVDWTYSLEDYGIKMSVNATGSDIKEKWVNIPLSDANPKAEFIQKPGFVAYKLKNDYVYFRFDKASEYQIVELTDCQNQTVNCLRVKMTDVPMDIEIGKRNTNDFGELSFSSSLETKKISNGSQIDIDIQNDALEKRDFVMMHVFYTELGRVISYAKADATSIDACDIVTVSVETQIPSDASYMKTMIWDSLVLCRPYDSEITTDISEQ